MTDDTKKDSTELEAIEAELRALGEEGIDDGEFELSERFGSAVEAGDIEEGPLAGLSLLRLRSASATLGESRSEDLLGSLVAKVTASGPVEVQEELTVVGESDVSDLEWQRSQALASVMDALASSEALTQSPFEIDGASEMAEELTAVARLRVSAARLGSERSEVLLDEVVEKSGLRRIESADNIVHLGAARRRSSMSALFAAAAAILMVLAASLIWRASIDNPIEAPTAVVAQVELEKAEKVLSQVERTSLKTLMAAQTVPAGQGGDHFLRNLRQARSDALRARRQARVRRL